LNFKGVLVDFGDTLAHVDEEENRKYEEAIQSTTRKYGYRGDLDDLSSSLSRLYWTSNRGKIPDLQSFWKLFLRDLGVGGQNKVFQELDEVWKHHYHLTFKLYEGAISALSSLKRKYELALVSNCAVGLRDVITDLGLTGYFVCIILSYEVGVRKPDTRMYLEALDCLGLEPNDCIFVADEISDLEGAREVGLKTLLVRQGLYTTREAKDPTFKPDFECPRVSEITNFL